MPSRRDYLAALGGAAALGGCVDRSAPGTPTNSGTGSPTGTKMETGTPEPTASADPTAISGSWTHLDADAGATLSTETDLLEAVPERLWTTEIGTGYRQVRLSGDALYTTTDTRLIRRSLADGEPRWERSFDGTARLGAALDDLYLTTGENEPTLYALEPTGNGPPTERWARDGVRFRRADADLVVATKNDNSRLFGLDSDGNERWALEVGDVDFGVDVEGERFDSVTLGPDHVFAAVESGGSAAWVVGVDRWSGSVAWTDTGPNHAGLLTVTPDAVLSGGFHGKVSAWSHDGNSLWETRTTPPVGRIAVADGHVFASANADSEPAVTALDEDGESLWTRATGTVSAVDAGAVYVLDDGVVALDPESGERRWRFDTAAAVQVVPADGGLFVVGETDLQLFG